MKKLLSLLLCLIVAANFSIVTAEDTSVEYSIDFSSTEIGDSLPEGFKVSGSATMQDGYLQVNSGSIVNLPTSLKCRDFTLEVDFTIVNANEPTRWVSFMYRGATDNSSYMQMCVRQGATAANGVEIACKPSASGNWVYNSTAAGYENIDASYVYTAKIVAEGGKITQYIDDDKINETADAALQTNGIFGLQASGSVLRVYGIRLTGTKVDESDMYKSENYRNVYRPETGLIAPATVIQTIDSLDELESLKEDASPAQAAWFTMSMKEDLTVELGSDVASLESVFAACKDRIIPIFEIIDIGTAFDVLDYAESVQEQDFYIASPYEDVLIDLVDSKLPGYIYLAYIPEDSMSIAEIARITNSSGALTAILEEATREEVEYLQKRFLTVTIKNAADSDEDRVCAALDNGANGVVVDNAQTAYDMYSAVDSATYVRRPVVVGHRGFPNVAPENTVEGMIEAYAAGADAVECDVYITKDDHIVINHNGNLSGYTTDSTATASVESLTRDELKEYTLTARGKYDSCEIAFLDEMYEVLLDNPDKVLVIEIKTGQTKIADLIYDLTLEYGVFDQIVVISFNINQLKRIRNTIPEVGVSFLLGASSNPVTSTESIISSVTPVPMAASPNSLIDKHTVENLMFRGISTNAWTLNGAGTLKEYASRGVMFLTTDTSNEAKTVCDSLVYANSKTLFGLLGDINGDESVTAADALLALQCAVKKITLTEAQIKVADVDGQEGILAGDALLILQRAVGKIERFPIEK